MNKLAAYQVAQPEQAVESLILEHLPLVKSIATHLHCKLPKHILLDDLIQCGIVGLVEAARRFQFSQGVQFQTFANRRIRGAIIDDLRKNDELPRSLQSEAQRLQKTISFLEQENGRSAHDVEIAQAMDISIAEYEDLLQAMNIHFMLSTDDIELVNDEPSHSEEPEFQFAKDEIKQFLSAQLSTLPGKEKMVLSLYYNEELNFKQIGEVLGVSESRISQLHAQALTRLQARLKQYHAMDLSGE